jgi:hypothetical protein
MQKRVKQLWKMPSSGMLTPCDSCRNRRSGGNYGHRHQCEKNQRARNNVSNNYQPKHAAKKKIQFRFETLWNIEDHQLQFTVRLCTTFFHTVPRFTLQNTLSSAASCLTCDIERTSLTQTSRRMSRIQGIISRNCPMITTQGSTQLSSSRAQNLVVTEELNFKSQC